MVQYFFIWKGVLAGTNPHVLYVRLKRERNSFNCLCSLAIDIREFVKINSNSKLKIHVDQLVMS